MVTYLVFGILPYVFLLGPTKQNRGLLTDRLLPCSHIRLPCLLPRYPLKPASKASDYPAGRSRAGITIHAYREIRSLSKGASAPASHAFVKGLEQQK